MRQIWLIATNTVRETTRRRIFYNIVLFGIFLVLLALVVSNITFSFADRVVRSIGLSGVSVAVDLMTLLVATSLVHEEIDRKTLFVVLTRPLSRTQYLLGRYLGLLTTSGIMLGALSLVFVVALSIAEGTPRASDGVALVMVLGEAAVLGAVGITLSCTTTPTLGAGLGLGVWIIGASTDDFLELTTSDATAHALATATSYVFPCLARLNFREAAVYAHPVELSLVAWASLYAAVYSVAVLALASLAISRRDMI